MPTQVNPGLLYPPDVAWRPVSPRLCGVRLAVAAGLIGLSAIGLALAGLLTHTWGLLVGTAGMVILGGLGCGLIPRQVRALAYGEGEAEFWLRSGVLRRRLSAVPYGRLQYVDVVAGPIARAFGISTLSLNTAAVGLAMTVPGLPPDEAAGLRQRLVARGEARMSGL